MRWTRWALLLGSFRILSQSRCMGEDTFNSVELVIAHDVPPDDACWVFHHMNRSGGNTVKKILRPFLTENDIVRGLYGYTAWRKGSSFATDFSNSKYKVAWGAYVEGMRFHGGMTGCKWFAMFRHPVARMVSAYFYCRQDGAVWNEDSICGSSIAEKKSGHNTDIVKFAEHWGNSGLRQFSLAFTLPDEILNSPEAEECSGCPDWYLLKLFLEGEQSNGEPGSTKSLDVLLEPVEELLRTDYAAVGIIENLNTTLSLFNRALEMPGFDWVAQYEGLIDSNDIKVDSSLHGWKQRVLDSSWENAALKKHLALDILLYRQAVDVHAEQIEKYYLG